MDVFSKMASLQESTLKWKLAAHVVTTLCIAVSSIVMYLEKPDNDKVVTVDTLLATLSFVAFANFLLSALNAGAELMKKEDFKDRLVNGVLNSARNIMTTLSLIIGCIVFGLQTEVASWVILCAVCVQRLLDATLDVGGFALEVQCPDDTDKASGKLGNDKMKSAGSKMLVASFAALAVGASIVMLVWYMIDTGISFDSQGDDDILLLISVFALGLHELLIVFTIAMSMKVVQFTLTKWISGGDKDCDGISVHSLNEIPLVSALVFTYNLLALSVVVGERLEENVSVNLLGSMIAIISIAEIAGRRMI